MGCASSAHAVRRECVQYSAVQSVHGDGVCPECVWGVCWLSLCMGCVYGTCADFISSCYQSVHGGVCPVHVQALSAHAVSGVSSIVRAVRASSAHAVLVWGMCPVVCFVTSCCQGCVSSVMFCSDNVKSFVRKAEKSSDCHSRISSCSLSSEQCSVPDQLCTDESQDSEDDLFALWTELLPRKINSESLMYTK